MDNEKIKISKWLSQSVDSHGIYDAELLAQNFYQRTGEKAFWSSYSVAETKRALKQRGLGGEVKGKGRVVYGYSLADDLASHYLPDYRCDKFGRGSQFREALSALFQAGM